jgi:hypothetical protein
MEVVMLKTRIVSSLEKAMLEDKIESFNPLERISALRGERLSFQLLHTFEYSEDSSPPARNRADAQLTAEGELVKYATFREVGNVPVERPTLEKAPNDDDYISKRPGLFPDILRPLHGGGSMVYCAPYYTMAIWVEINIPKDMKAGEYEFSLRLNANSKGDSESKLKIEIIDAEIPENELYFTQWFHCDSLAHWYSVEPFSEEHWEIIENFARVAVKNGINMLLTPVFTLPLDTAPGGERLTTQLVGVCKTHGKYSFDFSLVDRWVDMCNRIGIKYLEISHLFTQWGAAHAPKIMATVDGECKKIFGWETDATGSEYAEFLRTFLREFISHMKARGDDRRCFYHISDEPRAEHLESYKAAKAIVGDLLRDYIIMDALSDYDFWKLGILETPIPANNHIAPFIENNAPNLWTYYCCTQAEKVSNRFIAMPSCRNRSIGYQMYKFGIVGFLHWGYNFYANYYSLDQINPFLQQDGDGWVSPGDAFSVYPAAKHDLPYESIRITVFYDALQDIAAMKLCEELCGKDAVVKIIDEEIGTYATFDTCAKSSKQILNIRERVNALIKANLK